MRRTLLTLFAVAALFSSDATAQESAPVRTLFSSDSMIVGGPVISPDGRWLVFLRSLSNQETRLMIRPVAGGEMRELFADKGLHLDLLFSPQGDRLVFLSSLPRRGPSDVQMYLVAASFDTRAGTLTSTPRQVSLDPVRTNPRPRPVISPDGRSIAYIAVPNNELRVIPIVGGNARTLVEPESGEPLAAPGHLAWSPDGRSISYHVRKGEISTRFRVSIDGGKPSIIAQRPGGMGPVTPDGKYYFTAMGRAGSTLRFFSMSDGREVASVRVPRMNQLTFSPDGQYLVGRSDNTLATMKLVPVSGGPARTIGRGDAYEWGIGWSLDGQEVYLSEEEPNALYLRRVGLDGTSKWRGRIPDNSTFVGLHDGHLILREGRTGILAGWTLFAQRIADGKRTVMAENVLGWGCCTVTPAGGMYYGMTGEELQFLQVRDDRLQLRAMRLGGASRLIADFPRSLVGVSAFAVAGDRVAYIETVGDSTHLRVIPRPGQPAVKVASYPKSPGIGEFSWSHDGRMLSLYVNDVGQPMTIFRFDESGTLTGSPQTFRLPFEYYYETFWLRDGSGLTMIAQPRGAPNAEVALVKLADPQNPILLSKSDPGSKWGHLLSHDGKYVVYPAERQRGSSIKMLDVAELLRRATTR